MRQLLLFLCLFISNQQPLLAIWGGAYEPPPAPVHVAESEEQDVKLYYNTVGTLAPSSSAQVRAELTGMLLEIHVKSGEVVDEGTLLFTIDSESYDLKLEEAQAALQKERRTLEHTQVQYDRTQQLFEQQAASEKERKLMEEKLEAARGNVRVWEARVKAAEIPVRKSLVKAPISGRVGEVEIGRGNLVQNNDLLVVIDTISSLDVKFAVPERRFQAFRAEVEKGELHCEIWLPHDDKKKYDAEITFFQNRVDKATGTIGLTAEVDNKDRELWPGQFVKIRLLVEELEDVIVVPAKAVRRNEDGPFVFVLDAEDKAVLRPVTLGPLVDETQVIETGLEKGERVITEGQLDVQPGRQVKVIQEEDS